MGESSFQPNPLKNRTAIERTSDREMVFSRTFDAPPRIVFDAWTKPALFMLWWAPKSSGMPLLSCEIDARTGGGYRVAFGHDTELFAFYGKYLDVTPPSRLVWTNEESEDGSVTTVTFEEQGGKTLLTLHEIYPCQEALDESWIGMEHCMPEQFEQLDDVLATRPA